ncbi:hypothetical protein PFISCL1PPCAC_11736, partial [Pristionchus fissidentatus]
LQFDLFNLPNEVVSHMCRFLTLRERLNFGKANHHTYKFENEVGGNYFKEINVRDKDGAPLFRINKEDQQRQGKRKLQFTTAGKEWRIFTDEYKIHARNILRNARIDVLDFTELDSPPSAEMRAVLSTAVYNRLKVHSWEGHHAQSRNFVFDLVHSERFKRNCIQLDWRSADEQDIEADLQLFRSLPASKDFILSWGRAGIQCPVVEMDEVTLLNIVDKFVNVTLTCYLKAITVDTLLRIFEIVCESDRKREIRICVCVALLDRLFVVLCGSAGNRRSFENSAKKATIFRGENGCTDEYVTFRSEG